MTEKRPARQEMILDLLREQAHVSVAQLVDRFGVSSYRVRRDLDDLEERGELQRIRGGAVAVGDGVDLPLRIRQTRFSQEKQRIGAAAAQLIRHDDSLILDAGTTVFEIVPHLRRYQGLTVVTNSLLVAHELGSNCQLSTIVTGGNIGLMNYALVGCLAEERIRMMSVRNAFIAIGGLTMARGLTNPNLYEVRVKQAMMDAAEKVIVVADHSKLGRDSLAEFAPLSRVDCLITDSEADPELIDQIRDLGVSVELA